MLSLAACSGSSTSTTGTVGASTGATVGSTSSSGATTGATTAAASTSGTTQTNSSTSSGTVSGTTGTATSTSGSGSTTGGTTGALTPSAFAQGLNQAYCNFLLTCEDYASYVSGLCPNVTLYDPGDAEAAVDAGRVTFNPAQAATCLDNFADAGCSTLTLETVYTDTCVPALSGRLPFDAGCYANADCQSLSCSFDGCTPGVCSPISEVGEPCECSTAGCGACDPAGSLSCVNGVCVAPVGLGQTCDGTTGPCGAGLGCINDTCANIPVALGSPCTVDEGQCVSGSYCLAAAGMTTGTCVATVAAGQPCAQDLAHLPNALGQGDSECVVPGVVCLGAGILVDGGFASGTCTASSDVGGPCTLPSSAIDAGATYVNGCKVGLNCVGGTCTRPPSSGTCSPQAFPCDVVDAYCNHMTNTCEAPVAIGGDCTNASCVSNASCGTNDVCASECAGAL